MRTNTASAYVAPFCPQSAKWRKKDVAFCAARRRYETLALSFPRTSLAKLVHRQLGITLAALRIRKDLLTQTVHLLVACHNSFKTNRTPGKGKLSRSVLLGETKKGMAVQMI